MIHHIRGNAVHSNNLTACTNYSPFPGHYNLFLGIRALNGAAYIWYVWPTVQTAIVQKQLPSTWPTLIFHYQANSAGANTNISLLSPLSKKNHWSECIIHHRYVVSKPLWVKNCALTQRAEIRNIDGSDSW